MANLEARLSKITNSSAQILAQRFSIAYASSPRATGTNKASERSRSVMSRASKFKSKQFQLGNPGEKIFQHSQPLLVDRPRILGQNKEVEHLRKKLNETMNALDNQMLQVFHRQESNFLTAYKGVMRQIALELNHYKAELDKQTTEYKEGENGLLRKQLSLFSEEVENMLKITRKLEEDNRDLRKRIVELTQDLKCEKELAVSIAKKNRMHQEMAKLFYKENRQIIMAKLEDFKNFKEDLAEEEEGDFSEDVQEEKYEVSRIMKRESYDPSENSFTKLPTEPKTHTRFSDQKQYYSVGATESTRSHLKKEVLDSDRSSQYINTSPMHSHSPNERGVENEDRLLRNAFQVILKSKLKPEFDLNEVITVLLGKVDQCLKIKKGIIKQNTNASFEKASKITSQAILSHKQSSDGNEVQTLKEILAESIEGAMRNLLSDSAPSTKRPKSTTRSTSISQREVIDLLFNEKEVNKAISSAVDTVRTQNLLSNGNASSKANKTSDDLKNNKDDLDLSAQPRLSEDDYDGELLQPQNRSVSSNINTSPGKSRITPLNLEALNSKVMFEEDQKQRPKSKEQGRHGGIPKGSLHNRQSSLTDRVNQSKLSSMQKGGDKSSQGSSELIDKSLNDSQSGGTFRSKSPLTKRIVIQNGKLMVQ